MEEGGRIVRNGFVFIIIWIDEVLNLIFTELSKLRRTFCNNILMSYLKVCVLLETLIL